MEQNAKNWNIQSKELELLFKEIYPQIKPNPNNFIIIKKWNKRLFKKYKFKISDAIEKEIDLQLKNKCNSKFFNNFVNYNKI